MNKETYFRQLGTGVASLIFGVALSIFIYAAASGILETTQSFLLYITSFLLMLRFWWKYTKIFVQFSPSQSYWQFLFDFAISFFGILTVLFVNVIQTWAMLGMGAMIASMVRCGLSWSDVKNEKIKKLLKKTFFNSIGMFVVMLLVYLLSSYVNNVQLSLGVFLVVLFFVIYTSIKQL